MKKSKKVLATILAGVMTLSMAAPAFALEVGDNTPTTPAGATGTHNVDGENKSATVEFSVVMNTPTIKVDVGYNTEIQVNPYKLTVKVDDEDVTDTIITAPSFIANHSNVPVEIMTTVTGTEATGDGAVTFADAPVAQAQEKQADGTYTYYHPDDSAKTAATLGSDKQVYLTFQMKAVDDNTEAPDWVKPYDVKNTKNVTASTPMLNNATDGCIIVVANEASDTEEPGDVALKLAAADPDDGTPAYACYQLVGECNSYFDAESGTSWTASDKVDVQVAFTFNATAN